MNSRTGNTLVLFAKRAACALLLLLALSCAREKNDEAGISKPNPPLRTVTLHVGTVPVKAEVATSELERNRGLMYRKSLADGAGMLFVFEKDDKVAFYMKNTSIPLSIAYIAFDGSITQILDLTPFSEEARLSERSVRYALEVPQGWFERAGVHVGDICIIPAESHADA